MELTQVDLLSLLRQSDQWQLTVDQNFPVNILSDEKIGCLRGFSLLPPTSTKENDVQDFLKLVAILQQPIFQLFLVAMKNADPYFLFDNTALFELIEPRTIDFNHRDIEILLQTIRRNLFAVVRSEFFPKWQWVSQQQQLSKNLVLGEKVWVAAGGLLITIQTKFTIQECYRQIGQLIDHLPQPPVDVFFQFFIDQGHGMVLGGHEQRLGWQTWLTSSRLQVIILSWSSLRAVYF